MLIVIPNPVNEERRTERTGLTLSYRLTKKGVLDDIFIELG